ncbi:MAG: acyl-ACP--UDP-N-acetylglucosamine O-acyltransferase [Acidobacteria bacterium]|nr:acyl-ACP--UDP-N-acetylglucosamine O-acyltransferase [Acidobacteriota bacterium]
MRAVRGVEIHPTSVLHPGAELDDGACVGPYSVIGDRVRIGKETVLDSHVIVEGSTSIGASCRFFPFSSIGTVPQDLKYRGEDSQLVIGDRNTFREFVTVHRGTQGGAGVTRIGNDNFIMAYAHVAHDCILEDHVILANAVTLAGHVLVQAHAIVGASVGIHQFCRVGPYAFVGGYSCITRDVLPFVKTIGYRNEARTYGINSTGLKRKGIRREALLELQRAYRILVRSRLNSTQALARIRQEGLQSPEVSLLVQFVETCERGFIK